MMPTGRTRTVAGLLGAGVLLAGLLVVLLLVVLTRPRGPQPAPEAALIQEAQAALPFQVLIPAFLPARFDRQSVIVRSDLPGPNGETMFELVYSDRGGEHLVLHEWLPKQDSASQPIGFANGTETPPRCGCGCPMCGIIAGSGDNISANPFQVDRDRLRILAGVSSPEVVTYPELQSILSTLAPAPGLLVYGTLDQVPLGDTVPPAVPVEMNAQGVQELVLVVTPDGYTPPHFSVKAGAPVRITFRQLGYVGCGNELEIEWAKGRSSKAALENANDVEVIEFTPEQSGDFSYHCQHLIYRGVMTVNE